MDDCIYRAKDRVFRPWKNGGGETAEILAHPAGAGFDDFEWRISTAIVASDGPFSSFPGVDRVLTVLDGGAMRLTVNGEVTRLAPGDLPFAFPGESTTAAVLEGGSLLDFNVMTRRPLRAKVWLGSCGPAPSDAAAAYALLLEPVAGLDRLDLLDLLSIPRRFYADLAGARAINVVIR